ncbi:MAG TPA: hypothetical protein PK854_08880 [Oscillospiraceae bacterium]|nr:hypothetical protein [Oscillospiraceae bacterium]HPS35367.1 hypothetical protein [Oscillospiraceae bacterium]
MKKFVCGILICAMLVGGVMGCSQSIDNKVPARGVWDGQAYTNTETGIRLTVPERYHIDTDEELIKWLGLHDDYYGSAKQTGLLRYLYRRQCFGQLLENDY